MATLTATATTTVLSPKTSKKSSRPKPSAAQWKAAKEQAGKLTGYGSGSPIWSRKDVTVFAEIESALASADRNISTGDYGNARVQLEDATTLIKELQKREAYKRLIATLVDTTPVAAKV